MNMPDLPSNKKKKSNREYLRLFNEMFQTYYSFLLSYAIRWVNEKVVAEDIVQDLFLYLWSHKEEIDFSVSIKPYLYRSVYHKSLTYLKQSSIKKSIEQPEKIDLLIQEELLESDLFDKIIEKDLKEILAKLIEEFPEQRKNVYQLSREQGLKNREIAAHLKISEKTVEKHIKNSLETLRNKLKEMNIFSS